MMGFACSCFGFTDVDAEENNSSHHHGHCKCFSFCVQWLVNKVLALFQPGLPISAAAFSDSELMLDSSSATSSCDGSLPIDTSARYSLGSGDDLDGGSSRSHVEQEPFGAAVEQMKLLKIEDKLGDACMTVHSVAKNGVEYYIPSSEDEDVCPTCLEDYTDENPKIIAYCSHHYHLSCIYEWMERSEMCPVCGKLMEFDE